MYTITREIMYEYEQFLLGNRKRFSRYYFKKDALNNENTALSILKYVFETYLRWTPIEVRDCLNEKIIKQYKLETIIKYVNFPPELDKKKDLFYIAWKLYPNTANITSEDLVINVYSKILNKERNIFPKDFFVGIEGNERLKICLRYAIENYHPFNSIVEMYDFFFTNKSNSFLKKYKLKKYITEVFDNPIKAVYEMLPEGQNNKLLFDVKLLEYCELENAKQQI
jgi:hypothetical protein